MGKMRAAGVTMGRMRDKVWGTTCILLTCSVVDNAVARSREDSEYCEDSVFEIGDRCQQNLAVM